MTIAAMQAGDEQADIESSREKFDAMLVEPFPLLAAARTPQEQDLRLALGLSA